MISNAPQRRRRILELLYEEEVLATSGLPLRLGVTPMTVWRDVKALEEQGELRRLRGRIQRIEPRWEEPDVQTKYDRSAEAKRRIAAYAVKTFIREGDLLAVDGGTTVAAIARQPLPDNLTVLTNSIYTAADFLRHPSRPMVYACGGLLRERSGTFIGREALSFFSKRRTTWYFLSATGVDAEAGITDLTLEDNEVKQAMAVNSGEVVLLADRSKLGVISQMQVMPWRKIHHLVTDATNIDMQAILEKAGSGLQIHEV
jgi:DeoR/GlpR family transcriptional regulator of sugar metabolism